MKHDSVILQTSIKTVASAHSHRKPVPTANEVKCTVAHPTETPLAVTSNATRATPSILQLPLLVFQYRHAVCGSTEDDLHTTSSIEHASLEDYNHEGHLYPICLQMTMGVVNAGVPLPVNRRPLDVEPDALCT